MKHVKVKKFPQLDLFNQRPPNELKRSLDWDRKRHKRIPSDSIEPNFKDANSCKCTVKHKAVRFDGSLDAC